MPKAPSGEFLTVKVARVWTAATATEATALVLDTEEMGPIAFEVDERRIQILREKLATAEAMLARGSGSA